MDHEPLQGRPCAGLGYAGRERDPVAGLYQVRARWYDPQTGRFVSEDPIGLAGGMNPYAYAANDPVNLTDPSGLCPPGGCKLDPVSVSAYECSTPGMARGVSGACESQVSVESFWDTYFAGGLGGAATPWSPSGGSAGAGGAGAAQPNAAKGPGTCAAAIVAAAAASRARRTADNRYTRARRERYAAEVGMLDAYRRHLEAPSDIRLQDLYGAKMQQLEAADRAMGDAREDLRDANWTMGASLAAAAVACLKGEHA